MASQEVSRLIMGMDTYCSKVLDIVACVITFLCAIIYAYAFAKVISITLLFRPTSFLTTSNLPQLDLILTTYMVTIISGIVTYLPKIPYIAVSIFGGIVMILSNYMVFMPASFVRSLDQRLVYTSTITGGISCILNAVFAAIDKTASMAVLFVLIGIFVVIMIISFPVIEKFEQKCLRRLDEIEEDSSSAQLFKTPLNMIRNVCIGYKYAHPASLDWSVFKSGSETWPGSGILWATFGKFVAIYPEENNLLTYIIHNIESKKLKGNFAKQTIAQGRTVLTQRDTSLSPELKRKMQHIQKAVQHSKRKLRHIWDGVIQGNTHEMENAVNGAYKAINKTEAEFMHVLSQYPNNRFIARSYARFLEEIKADLKGFQVWVEKVKLLQRGLKAHPDNTNILGCEAFPNLPHVLSVKNETQGIQNAIETESAFQLEVDIEDEQVSEQMSGVRDQINSLQIPSLCFVSFCSIFTFFILILAPVIAIFFYSRSYINSLYKPFEFLYYLSYLRTLANQLPAFSFHSIFESYPNENDAVLHKPNLSDIEVTSLANNKETKEQYKYLIKELTMCLEAIGQYRAFGANEETLQPALSRAFKSVINYRFFQNNGNFSNLNVSIQSALMDYTIQLSKLSTLKNVTEDILVGPIVMNPIANTDNLNDQSSLSIECVVTYLKHVRDDMSKLMMIILIVIICFFVVYYVVLTIIEVKKVQSNKNEIYSCLTTLPKNVVSALAEALRVLKKDTEGTRTTENDTEISKQHDNILKIFASAGDTSSSVSTDRHVFVPCNIILLVIDILLTYFLTEMFKDVTKNLAKNGPHLSYVFGSVAYMMEIMNTFNVAAVQDANYFKYLLNTSALLTKLTTSHFYFNYYYQHVKFGGEHASEPPYPFFKEVVDEAIQKFSCPDENAVPSSYKDIYTCFNPDQQATLFSRLVQSMILPVKLGNSTAIDYENDKIDDLWYISAILLYESFFHPMFTSILPHIEDNLDSAVPSTTTKAVILVVVAFVILIVKNVFASIENKKFKFALSLLLHCQYQVIMQTQKIVDLLNGHFTSKGKDMTTRNSRFFVEVVSNLPDSIIIANNQMIITSANKSTERIYSIDASSLVDTKITDFLSSKCFSEDMTSLITNAAPVGVTAPSQVCCKFTKEDGSTSHLELSCIMYTTYYIITTRDVTRGFVYNTLIEEERAKSDALLASILPPSLVPRVQRGEKNISFAVQSATILFLDIVEFTPWCGSNTAAMVMSTLNTMFKYLDNKLATHSTATKIKCIGDCYMCAGGIFSEINQPNVHAKEIVEFGQESIECIRQLDEELNVNLRIRVGINTGGPIVAGVLGTEKPTFEILGPAINMAQQMEHHGVPMQVHISRSVYELIYGGSFIIKERGQIEIKSGKAVTYLVQDKES